MTQRSQIEIDEKYFYHDVDQFVASNEFRQLHDEVILLKGSRRFGFERLPAGHVLV